MLSLATLFIRENRVDDLRGDFLATATSFDRVGLHRRQALRIGSLKGQR
jgi:hypothetical protein